MGRCDGNGSLRGVQSRSSPPAQPELPLPLQPLRHPRHALLHWRCRVLRAASLSSTPSALCCRRAVVHARGNYWGPAGTDDYDLTGDGMLDIPHAISSPLAELALTHPGLRLWLHSPAAHALGWAERTFPVFATNGAIDPCPLASAPRTAMLTRLPDAPAAQLGGNGTEGAAAAIVLAGGFAGLIAGWRRKERVRA